MRRQAGRPSNNSPQLAANLRTDDEIGESVGISGDTLRRYIRLTYLIPVLLQAVDEKKLGLTIGATLSFLSRNNQEVVEAYCLHEHSVYISLELADRLREADQGSAKFTPEMLEELVQPSGKNLRKVTLPFKTVRRYFSEEATQEEIETTIQQALKLYFATKD